MNGLAVLFYSIDEIRKMYGGIFLYSNLLGFKVMSNFEFCDEPRKLRLLITSKWIWIEKHPTVHLPYFIDRVRQNCQTNHFPFLRERFLVSFFQNFEFENRWFDDVTWLLSTNFMKDRQGECLGKISHPYRVWKVYKHRFSENTELAIGRTLIFINSMNLRTIRKLITNENFQHYRIKFRTFSKVRKYEIKYCTKICDFTVFPLPYWTRLRLGQYVGSKNNRR